MTEVFVECNSCKRFKNKWYSYYTW